MFPQSICKHRSGRNLFAEYGDVGNATFNSSNDCDDLICIFQKELKISRGGQFCANEPSLPVLPPNNGIYLMLSVFSKS